MALTKFDPVTVRVRSGLPTTALVGEIELIEGTPGEGVVTLKLTEFDFLSGRSPIGSPVCTNTSAVPGLLNKAAGITAVSWVLLTKVVASKVLLLFTDHTA